MNKYLQKVSVYMSKETHKELANTATIGAAGAVTGALTNRILHGAKGGSNLKAGLIGGGLGLLGDYAAVKLNKHINARIDKQ